MEKDVSVMSLSCLWWGEHRGAGCRRTLRSLGLAVVPHGHVTFGNGTAVLFLSGRRILLCCSQNPSYNVTPNLHRLSEHSTWSRNILRSTIFTQHHSLSCLRPKSLMRITASSIVFFTDPNVKCTPYSYAPRSFTASKPYGNLRPSESLRTTLLAGRSCGRKIASGVSNIVPKGQLYGSPISVTNHFVDNPDYCEWRSPPPGLPLGGLGRDGTHVACGS